MKYLVIGIVFLFNCIAVPLIHGYEGNLILDLEIDDSYSVIGYDIHPRKPNEYPTEMTMDAPNKMQAVIYNINNVSVYSTDFLPNFNLLTNPPRVLNITRELLVLPMTKGTKFVRMYQNESLKFELDIASKICNQNNFCDIHENHIFCPEDCSTIAMDGICTSVSGDNGCDPDCHPSRDMDCSCPNQVCEEWENQEHCPQDCTSGGSDGYCDSQKDGKCDPDCERKQDKDCHCPDGICQIFETSSTCPRDCPIESGLTGNDFLESYWLHILIIIASIILIFALIISRKTPSQKDGDWGKVYKKLKRP